MDILGATIDLFGRKIILQSADPAILKYMQLHTAELPAATINSWEEYFKGKDVTKNDEEKVPQSQAQEKTVIKNNIFPGNIQFDTEYKINFPKHQISLI